MNLSSSDEQSDMTSLKQLLVDHRYTEAEQAAAEAIRENALLPQRWVMLGEALLHQGLGAAARKVFNRAWLLDPEAGWVDEVERAIQRVPSGAARADIDELLAVRSVTLTIGIIVMNEERSLARCLQSIQGAADEIVVIDGGSTDRTVEIASSFANVRVVHSPWRDDFAAQRNAGLSLIKNDWVLWIDADEHLHPDDVAAVKEVAGIYDELLMPPVLSIWQVNRMNGMLRHDFSQARMFCTRFGLRYYGKVHEQIGPANGDLFKGSMYRRPVRLRFLHDGYEPEIVKQKDKLRRNLDLLAKMVEEDPGNPGWWLYYGRESLAMGRTEEALAAFLKAEETAADKPNFARMLDVYMYVTRIYMTLDDLDQAEEACRKAIALNDQFPDALFQLAAIQMKKAYRLKRDAEKLLRASKDAFAVYRGAVSPDYEIKQWKADISLADIARSVGKFADAAYMYEQISREYPQVTQTRKPIQQIKDQLNKLRKKPPAQ